MKRISEICVCVLMAVTAYGQTTEMVLVKGGEYLPLYGTEKNAKTLVEAFYMDITPVTHAQFLEFVLDNQAWRKPNVKGILADERYLQNWENDTTVPESLHHSPVNNVSWFAAKAYCQCYGKRLPTLDEWEFVAMADENKPDAREDSLFNARIIRTYEKPKTYLMRVGSTPKNYWGIYDIHGLVWEWTEDFNSVIITGESRSDNATDKGLFCASGAVGASDLMDYAAFMRYAMRSSIKANYTLSNTGFRCVRDYRNGNL